MNDLGYDGELFVPFGEGRGGLYVQEAAGEVETKPRTSKIEHLTLWEEAKRSSTPSCRQISHACTVKMHLPFERSA